MLEVWMAYVDPPTVLAAESTLGHSYCALNISFVVVRIA